MGIEFGSKVKKTGAEKPVTMTQFFDGLIDYAKSAKMYYKSGSPAKSRSELNTVIWYAENIRLRL